jgi:Zn-dependent metalloprotease
MTALSVATLLNAGPAEGKFEPAGSYKQPPPPSGGIERQDLIEIGNRYRQSVDRSQQLHSVANEDRRLRQALERIKQRSKLQSQDSSPMSADLLMAVRHFADNGTPVFMSGAALKKFVSGNTSAASLQSPAIQFIADRPQLFLLNDPYQELEVEDLTFDRRGRTHIRFRQVYRGVPYWGQTITLHFDHSNSLYAVNARYQPTPEGLSITPNLSESDAIAIAVNELTATGLQRRLPPHIQQLLNYTGPQAELCIWAAHDSHQAHLVWQVEIRPNTRDQWYYFVDAASGAILQSYNNTRTDGPATATATDLNDADQTVHCYEQSGVYRMIDASRPIWETGQVSPFNDPQGAIITYDLGGSSPTWGQLSWINSIDNSWNDPTAVSAHYHAGVVFDYYYNTHGRLGIDNFGSNILSVIHVADQWGQPMDNAYWNGVYVAWGDGDNYFKPLAGALDVAAHEMTHGVVEYTVGLEYQFQSGALDESFADVVGALVDAEDWLIAEDIVEPAYFPTGAMRDLSDPHNGAQEGDPNWQPAHMDEYVDLTLSQDNGGVHINSGIPNHAAYLIGEELGRAKLGEIYYRVLDARYLSKYSQFIDMRLAAIQAAEDLYGEESAEVEAVESAFTAVGIGAGPGTEPPPDDPPMVGQEWIAVVNDALTDNSLYLVSPDNPPTTEVQLTSTQVFINTGKPMDVCEDGSHLVFVDADNNIRMIDIDTQAETVLSQTGEWFSVAYSPDGSKLAATSIYIDTTIYIMYLDYPDSVKAIKLYSPTTQDSVRDYITEYADVMDWDANGEFLVFDAHNSVPQSEGDNIEYWEVNMLDVEQELIIGLFPAQEEGVSMGNPSFAETNDLFLVFDKVDYIRCDNEVVAVNLFNGSEGIIVDAGCVFGEPNFGFPKFSPNDRRIAYQNYYIRNNYVDQIEVDDSRINAASEAESWQTNAMLPLWFVRGNPVDVEDVEQPVLPTAFTLYQNYPNPFNPNTVIAFALDHSADVELVVYDILGRKVRTLTQSHLAAGLHRFEWNGRDSDGVPVGSGVYLYRLRADEETATRKMVLLK